VLFFGFDSASWKILAPLINKDELPNISFLIKTGASCIVKALDPPISPVLWTSIATAKLPDKHGILDFLATSTSVKCKRIWEILEQAGYTIGLFGHFLTWPPQKVKGFNIPIILSQSPETCPGRYDFIPKMVLMEKKGEMRRPLTYLKFMAKSFQNGMRPATFIKAGSEYLRQILSVTDYRNSIIGSRTIKEEILSDIFIRLYSRYCPEYSFYHCHIADSISHNFWRYYEPQKFSDISFEGVQKYRDVIPNAYRRVDRIIGRLLRKIDSHTLMVVASDHGAKANVSSQRKKPYLLRSAQLTEALGLTKEVNVVNLNLGALMRIRRSASLKKDEIVELIKSVTAERTKERVFDIQGKGYDYIYIELNPYLEDVENTHMIMAQRSYPLKEFVRISSDRMSGTHDIEDALLILKGENIKENIRLTDVSILDIVPSILAWLNLPVAKDMDGRVITEAFEDSYLKQYSVNYIDSYESEERPVKPYEGEMTEKIKKELQGLGYLD